MYVSIIDLVIIFLLVAGSCLADPRPGILRIRSSPDSATVTIDWKECGRTPFETDRLKPGNHVVVVGKEGYPQTNRQVATKYAEHVSLFARLVPDTQLTADPGDGHPDTSVTPAGLYRMWIDTLDGYPELDWYVRVAVPPQPVKTVTPKYPTSKTNIWENAEIDVGMLIDETGTVLRTEITRSTSIGTALGEAARASAIQWKFKPELGPDGAPVRSWVVQPFCFRIGEKTLIKRSPR